MSEALTGVDTGPGKMKEKLVKHYREEMKGGLEALVPLLERGLERTDLESFHKARSMVGKMRNTARELWQEQMRPKVAELISSLKKNRPLSEEEMKLLRNWMVGDAEHYARLENNFNDWIEEVRRLSGIFSSFKDSQLGEGDLRKIQAHLLDLHSTLDDVIRYLEIKERISRFERSAAEGIDKESAKSLVEIINSMLESEEY